MTGVLATLLVLLPVRTAETVPAGTTMLHLDGGFSLVRLDVPALPVAPALTGTLELAHGITDWLDLRGRYVTHLGLIHRLGPELRAGIVDDAGWSLAARVHPSAQIVGSGQEEIDLGGDVSTTFAILGTRREGTLAITLDVGVTVQWLLFERIAGRAFVDDVPYLGFVDAGLGIEWATSAETNLSVQLEVAVPTAPDDPFTVLGVAPRLTAGGSFEL